MARRERKALPQPSLLEARAAAEEAKKNALIAHLSEMHFRVQACRLARIPRATFYRWISVDEDFRDRVEQAEAEAEALALATIRSEMRDPKGRQRFSAAAWFLERRYPDRYGAKASLAVSTEPPGPGALSREQIRQLTTEQLEVLEEARRIVANLEAGPPDAGAPEPR